MTAKQDYVNELNSIAKRYGAMEDETIRQILALLKELRNGIAGEIGQVTDWDSYRARQMDAALQRLVDEFMAQASADAQAAFRAAVADGELSTVEPLRAIGVDVGFFQPSKAQVNVALDFSARLIQNIGDDVRKAVDQQIRLATLGQKHPLDAMRAITDALGIEARTGVWKKRPDVVRGVAARAETDLRTEMQRMYNLAAFSQAEDGAQRVPGMTKSWMATSDGRTRIEHLQAHQRYKENPIPVDEPFIVGGEKLMYPGDPNASARATVNCRCRAVYHHPAVGRVGSPLDARVAAELERRNPHP
jgi:hypothetical protein